jgi:rod shape determining protein RodA
MIDRRYIEHLDWFLLLLVCTLAVCGIVTIYSVTFDDPGLKDYQKQIIWVALSIGILIFTLFFDYKYWIKFSPILYGISSLLLIYVLFTPASLGVHRWILLPGDIRIQPSEFAKVSQILFLAYWFSRLRGLEPKMRDLFLPALIFSLPFLLILVEPDLGTSMTLAPLFISLVFCSGFSIKKMVAIILIFLIPTLCVSPYVLKPYQVKRITSFLHPEDDPLGSGYHLIQSQIAIGSGGIGGKGFKAGTQSHLDFLPVQDTDFIFAVWGEERGFLGATILLSIYFLLFFRILHIARLSRDLSGTYLCVGFAILLFCQVIINTGMVIGLMPVTGIPLPFLSYGGSASFVNFFSIGLILNVSMRKFPDYNG